MRRLKSLRKPEIEIQLWTNHLWYEHPQCRPFNDRGASRWWFSRVVLTMRREREANL
jgi:hypothetical protein